MFADGGARYPQRSGDKATIKIGGKVKTLWESFADDSPQIDFSDGSPLIYSHLYSIPDGETLEPYPAAKIETWDWSNANIRVESQGTAKRADSVQRQVIERLLAGAPTGGAYCSARASMGGRRDGKDHSLSRAHSPSKPGARRTHPF
jgi:hypothetical protein